MADRLNILLQRVSDNPPATKGPGPIPHAPPTIRPAADADSGQVASLIAACWVDYPGCILDIAGEEPILRAVATGFLAKDGLFWVACRGEWVVGCCGIASSSAADGDAEVMKLYVHPQMRRQGLARRLVSIAEGTARDWRAASLDLWSDTRFVEAHAFYRAIGYSQTGETRDLDDLSNTTEYRFRRQL